ncbi:hypothetical protein [Metabacillus fastidiosus]|uniref:hypothetical protein n=1 Tax=Metabacillus fastidiosus TaxID=1458 RepID=UPI002E1AC24F|nr:hypothetical protein [Metabacillus fastidiosus]
MNEQKNEIIINNESTMGEVLEALNLGITIDMIAASTGKRKEDIKNKAYNAGIEELKNGQYRAISDEALDKCIGSKIYDIRKKRMKREGSSKGQIMLNNIEQLNSDIRKFMIADREKAKQYTPSQEIWQQVKLLQKYLFNVQQDWLIDALLRAGLNSIEFPDELIEILNNQKKETKNY